MNAQLFRHIRGLIRRWYRKRFHKEWEVVERGPYFFQEFADLYDNTINDVETVELFFKDFMEQTNGQVIVDFLDTDNWDCIRKVEVDKQNGLIWFYWQIPSGEPIEERIRRMVFPLGYYGMCLKFDNVRFVRDKWNRCIGIIVNGYTIRERNIKSFATNGGWEITEMNSQSSFFSTNVVRKKKGIFQQWRFVSTPISSFWIIPKQLNIHPQDSEKLLYILGVDKCEKDLKTAVGKTKGIEKLNLEQQRTIIREVAHKIRTISESLFKLIMCFYQEEYQYKVSNYDEWLLGNLIGPLKKTIYKNDFEQKQINEIPKLANDLSHDSGNPIDITNLSVLIMDISYFIGDFKSRIMRKGHERITADSDRPSPHNYVQKKYKRFCFIDEIKESVHENSGKISFKIKAQIGMFVDIFGERGDEVLCKDGYIRNSTEDDLEILKVWDRDEAIALLDKMYQKVVAECKANGYDTETLSLGISFKAELKKEGMPSHLFTENEIEKLMRNADDNHFNKLVIDENGYAHIIQNPNQGGLYPVTQETWCAGNMYVGKESSLSDLHDSYVLCMHLWLAYLKTGRHMYDDCYLPDVGLDKVIKEVKKFYSNGSR